MLFSHAALNVPKELSASVRFISNRLHVPSRRNIEATNPNVCQGEMSSQ